MAETKGFTWDYDVNSQKRDEGVKPCARAMVTRGRPRCVCSDDDRARWPIAHAQAMAEGGWPIAHAQTMAEGGWSIAHAQTVAEGGWPIAHACAYAVVMAKRQKAHAGSA